MGVWTEEKIIKSADKMVTGMMEQLVKENGQESADRYFESAARVAAGFIGDAGYDEQDSDYFGQQMGDVFQALLTAAFLRLPHSNIEVLTDGLTMDEVGGV